MKTLLLLVAANFSLALADMKSLGEAMHGEKMAVSYEVLNSGKHVLIVKEKTGKENKKAKFKQLQVIEVSLKEGETLSPYDGFKCRNRKNDLLYAIVSKGTAKKNESFAPIKSWTVDEKNMKVIPTVEKNELVACKWEPDGDSDYPY